MTQKVPKKFWKELSLQKSATKVLKFQGVGGQTRFGNTQIKAAFFCGASLSEQQVNTYRGECLVFNKH